MSKKPISIGGDWKALEIKGEGCIVQGDMGMVFVPRACIMDGEVVSVDFAKDSRQLKLGPAGQAAVNIKGFVDTMKSATLSLGGEYGAYGPCLGLLHHALTLLDRESATATALGTFLSLGDHKRFGFAGAVIALKPEELKEFSSVLIEFNSSKIEAFVNSCVNGAA